MVRGFFFNKTMEINPNTIEIICTSKTYQPTITGKENNIQKSNLWKDPKHFFTIECTQINNFGEHDASVQRKWK